MHKTQLEYVKCNYCDSSSYSIIYKAKYDKEKFFDLKKKIKSIGHESLIDQIVKCNNCNLVYTNPRLKASLIKKSYSEGFNDKDFISQVKGRELTFIRTIKLIEKYSKKGKILDIGTAAGSFLHIAKNRGWKVYGIELDKWFCDWSKEHYGLDIKCGTLFDYKFKDNYFDVITLFDVIEHIPDPKSFLLEINRILKKDGILVINYPDIGSFVSKLMGAKWPLLLSQHIFYFNSETIKKMLEATNFEIFLMKKHIQRLALGYLVYRTYTHSQFIYKIMSKLVNALKLQNIQMPYWLGQTSVLAIKK